MDERIIDFGTFIFGAFVVAILFYLPSIQEVMGDNPVNKILIGIFGMVLSQIGSRYVINSLKQPIKPVISPDRNIEPPVEPVISHGGISEPPVEEDNEA